MDEDLDVSVKLSAESTPFLMPGASFVVFLEQELNLIALESILRKGALDTQSALTSQALDLRAMKQRRTHRRAALS